ncbi:MAG: ATP-binding protein [Methyloglobulus sp.]
MKIVLGHDDYLLSKNQESLVYCDFDKLVNAHILIMGKTGMGKTSFLRMAIQQMQHFFPTPRIHIMDVHGDINLNGASSIRFSESTEYGLNPFVVSADPHFGGIRKRVQDFIATINGCHPTGARQEAVMRHLITDLYAANGFFADNYNSWGLNDGAQRRYPKRYPTMEDACRFAFGKLKQLIIGSDTVSGRALEELNRVTSKLYKISKQFGQPGCVVDESLGEKAMELRTRALQAYRDYIENLETGKELEGFIKYESKEVLRSVVERFENLKASGIFKNQAAPFDPANPVWHYDITALREDEKRMFVEFRLQELFSTAMEKGPVRRETEGLLRDIMVIDEAHLFFRDDQNNILNTIAKEGRKFGLGLVCASQSPTHFSEDFFSNVATKVVLGVDQMYWDNLVRKMKIETKTLQYVKPFQVIGVQMSNKGDTRSRFTMVRIKDTRSSSHDTAK